MEILQMSNDPQPNSPKTPEQLDPLFNMSSSNSYTQGRQMRVKVELPKYDKDERQCIAWINKAEEYLDIHNIHYDGEKIKYASMHLEGSTYNWYLWWNNIARICSYNWVSFRNDLIKRFQGIEEKDFFAKITRLQQKNSVDEYTCEWEALSTRVPELTDDQRL